MVQYQKYLLIRGKQDERSDKFTYMKQAFNENILKYKSDAFLLIKIKSHGLPFKD